MSSVPAAEPLAEFLPRPKPTGWRPVWFLAAWYALAPMIGFSETFGLVSSRLMYLQTFGPSLCLAGWAITDSIRRRRPIPILSWDWYTLAAVVLVPLYVVRTRGVSGVGRVLLHAVLWYAMVWVGAVLAILLYFDGNLPEF